MFASPKRKGWPMWLPFLFEYFRNIETGLAFNGVKQGGGGEGSVMIQPKYQNAPACWFSP